MEECTVMADRRDAGGAGGALRRAKALSAPTRVQMIEYLRAAHTPPTAAELSVTLGIHHTVVRDHLALLIDAGLVRGEPLPIVGRGRPRTGYLAIEVDEPVAAYRTLAGLLAEMVSTGETAREVGRRAGAAVPTSAGGAVAAVRAEAERLGFRPHLRSKAGVHEVVLRECPFVEVAVERPETVCDIHLGLAEGVCERGGDVVVDGLRLADPRKGGCRIVMRDITAP